MVNVGVAHAVSGRVLAAQLENNALVAQSGERRSVEPEAVGSKTIKGAIFAVSRELIALSFLDKAHLRINGHCDFAEPMC